MRDIISYLFAGLLDSFNNSSEALYQLENMEQNQANNDTKQHRRNTSDYKEHIRVQDFIHTYSVATLCRLRIVSAGNCVQPARFLVVCFVPLGLLAVGLLRGTH
jgi:hypothetical protein